jgi:hypothetical protein
VIAGQAPSHAIRKRSSQGVPANMADYERARAEFSWAAARREVAGLPGGGLNIAHEAVDRHADGPLARTVALRFLGRGGEVRELTYAELRRQTDRFANVLRALGVGRGERVFVLAGRIPELYVTTASSPATRGASGRKRSRQIQPRSGPNIRPATRTSVASEPPTCNCRTRLGMS